MVTDACRRGRGSGTGPAIGAATIRAVELGSTEPVAVGSASVAPLVVVSDGLLTVPSGGAESGWLGLSSTVESRAVDGSDDVSALAGGGIAGGVTLTEGSAGSAATLTGLGMAARGGKMNERMNQVTPARKARTSAITIVADSNR